MNSPFVNKTVLQILNYYKNIWALGYVSAVSHWDLETYMPPKGAAARGEALAKISSISQKMFLDKHFIELIHKAEKEKDLTDYEKGVVRRLLHSLKFYERLPGDFLEEFEKLTNTATVIWRRAKETDDYKLFEPSLTKIFEMNRKAAEYLGYENSPYDALLDQFEEGLAVSTIDPFFEEIREPLKELLSKIESSPKFKEKIPGADEMYSREEMEKVNRKILDKFWGDWGRFRMDVSAHPFTTSFSVNDTRITTRYNEKGFSSLSSVVHEFGHALYELQISPDLEQTPVGNASSLVIHESQSRFWENFIGTRRDFIEAFLPDFKAITGEQMSVDDIYFASNFVKPGLIRVNADEVTYHFHIMLRYEIEKGIIEGSLKASDLKEIWNSKMKEYLGLAPEKDSEGILQDVHWSGGMVGYFPTYSLGTFLGAQWEREMNIAPKIENIGKIKDWLKEHVHQYGSTYTLADLLKKNGMKFDPQVNLQFLTQKYAKIYGF